MGKLKLCPDRFTFPSVVNACAGLLDVELGKTVHHHVVEMGFGSDLYIGNALIDMYARFGCLDRACHVFDSMHKRDAVSWNSIISGFCANEESEKALEFYFQMKVEGLVPDSFTVGSVFLACGNLIAIEEGEITHGLTIKIGAENYTAVTNGLIAMYCKFDYLIDARRLFERMIQRDNVSWNTMISGYTQSGDGKEAIKLFQAMIIQFKPDLFTITAILRACGQMRDFKQGRLVHEYMIRNGYEIDTTAGNILITMYAQCGNLEASKEVFNQLRCKDSVSWNSLISGYIHHGSFDEAIECFKMMFWSDVKPDSVTYITLLSLFSNLGDLINGKVLHTNLVKMSVDTGMLIDNALISMYMTCGSEEAAFAVFEMMGLRDIVTWNAIITGSVQAGNFSLGLRMFSQMKNEGIAPDMATFLGALPACSFLAAKRHGKEIHGYILKHAWEHEIPVGNSIIDMYSRCGNLVNSVHVFNQMKGKDVVSWTTLIFAYGMYGNGRKALELFAQMEEAGIKPDHVAFIAVLYACSHTGLVKEGLTLFDRMNTEYKIVPIMEHYACVVDLLSRSGHLEEAENFIKKMPFKPDASIWGCLLSACRVKGDNEMAERLTKQITWLDSKNTGYYILMSNINASMGKWDEVKTIRKSMKAQGLRKVPGYSWIEINNKMYVFGTGDLLVEQSAQLYHLLKTLADLMVKEGYIADRSFVLHDVEEDDKTDMLCGHSERLAIAFGLLNTKQGTRLQIMKNLRVCGDCHVATKYISKIVQREILVRDANRFHLFKNGSCSCGDYW